MPIFHDVFAQPAREVGRSGRKTNAWNDSHVPPRQPDGGSKEEAAVSPAWNGSEGRPISRGELIGKIKRRESPIWTTEQDLRSHLLSNARAPSPQLVPSETTPSRKLSSPPSPAAEPAEPPRDIWHHTDIYQAGLEIARPRSALHAGDFRDEKTPAEETTRRPPPLSTTPPAPWSRPFPSTVVQTLWPENGTGARGLAIPPRAPSRSRTVSQSSFSRFVLLPPTSPLANASLNPDLVTAGPVPFSANDRNERSNRRHTFSPHSFQTFQSSGEDRFPVDSPTPYQQRREGAYPYQAHQPRRSIGSTSQFLPSGSAAHRLRPGFRRPSIPSDVPSLHHAPMVGSYEESILRGRMSMAPSRPLNFVAQIGVLGRGNCKASLRCPPHATVPFPAVYYSYGVGSGLTTDNQPSPYVGLVDIENSLAPGNTESDENRRRRRHVSAGWQGALEAGLPPASSHDGHAAERKPAHPQGTPPLPKQLRAPPGGSYRIPPAGQLQIVIKNPHKTAVKLFLVPYDLSDMQAGTKTFIRQRSYSAGPIIDMPLSSRANLGTDRPEASLSSSDDPRDRPVLRYLVHLNVCCLGRQGAERFYLYKSVRVVFANRVPDGKERLRNEIQLSDPKYSAYKPSPRDAVPVPGGPQNGLAQDLADRRRGSAGAFRLAAAAPSDLDTPRGDEVLSARLRRRDTVDAVDWHLPRITPPPPLRVR